jgi:hypothetical protein
MKNHSMLALFLGLLGLNAVSTSAWAAQSVIEGTVAKVVESKKEIYVESSGKKYEYYFNDSTQVLKQGSQAQFQDLKKGMKVKVTAEKKGKRLDPQAVEILQ